jgi:hypothetical protein
VSTPSDIHNYSGVRGFDKLIPGVPSSNFPMFSAAFLWMGLEWRASSRCISKDTGFPSKGENWPSERRLRIGLGEFEDCPESTWTSEPIATLRRGVGSGGEGGMGTLWDPWIAGRFALGNAAGWPMAGRPLQTSYFSSHY